LTSSAFTVVELMVVVLIIGILVSIAIVVYPTATGGAGKKACFANERTVEGMWVSYVANKGRPDPDVADWAQLTALLVPDYLREQPTCASGGVYTWDDDRLTCSVHGHF
jgi:prepilin-type N-terminal cleavage/methylation domain-containing protein